MTTFDKNLLLILVAALTLVTLPMALAGAQPIFTEVGFFPIVIAIEAIVYFIAVMVMNPKATAGMATGTALIFTITRAICSLLGGVLYGVLTTGVDAYNPAIAWINPVTTVIQMLVLIAAGPYILAVIIPELVGVKDAEELRGDSKVTKVGRPTMSSGSVDASPTGGFVQVFSFEELAGVIKKSPGLEGFIISNDEGFVVWKYLPMKVDTDSITARLMGSQTLSGQMLLGGGLTRLRKVILDTRDHKIMVSTLNQNFGLILIFNHRTSSEELMGKVEVLTKTAREFLQWKYPSLPLATGLTRDRISLESV